MQEIEIFQGQT